jgi:hypothetical protein
LLKIQVSMAYSKKLWYMRSAMIMKLYFSFIPPDSEL